MLRNGTVIKHVYVICLNIGKFIYLNRKIILLSISTVLNSSKVQYIKMSIINTWIENSNGEEIHRYWSMQVFCYAKILFFYRQQL